MPVRHVPFYAHGAEKEEAAAAARPGARAVKMALPYSIVHGVEKEEAAAAAGASLRFGRC